MTRKPSARSAASAARTLARNGSATAQTSTVLLMPVCEANSATSPSGSLRSSAVAMIARASGCSDCASTAAAAASSVSSM